MRWLIWSAQDSEELTQGCNKVVDARCPVKFFADPLRQLAKQLVDVLAKTLLCHVGAEMRRMFATPTINSLPSWHANLAAPVTWVRDDV